MRAAWPAPDPEALGESARVEEPIPPTSPFGVLLVVGLLLSIGVLYSWGAFIFVVALVVCIFLHELGHYLAAKRAGMKVTQFFLFFGPRLWSFRRGETEYGIRALPLGAFVKVPGMHNMDADVAAGDEARTFRQAPFHSRFLMAAAGSCMHFLIALVLLFVSLVFVGRPASENDWTIGAVEPGLAAASAGLQTGDRIVAIDGTRFVTYEAVVLFIRSHPATAASFTVLRNGSEVVLPATIGTNPDKCLQGVGLLGIRPDVPALSPVNPVRSVPQSFEEFGRTVGLSVQALGQIFSPSGLGSYGKAISSGCNTDKRMLGPIGAAKAGAGLCSSLDGCLAILISANIFIGIVNWFPMLPFDGGHMLVAVYEKVRSRKRRYYADVSKLLPFTYALVAVMLLLFLGNTYLDLRS